MVFHSQRNVLFHSDGLRKMIRGSFVITRLQWVHSQLWARTRLTCGLITFGVVRGLEVSYFWGIGSHAEPHRTISAQRSGNSDSYREVKQVQWTPFPKLLRPRYSMTILYCPGPSTLQGVYETRSRDASQQRESISRDRAT